MRRPHFHPFSAIFFWCALAGTLGTGCASAGGPDENLMDRPRIRTVTVESLSPSGETTGTGTTTIQYEEDPIVIDEEIPSPRDEVWSALLQAHRELDLIPDGLDPAGGLVSLSRFRLVDEWNGVALSLLFDCGVATSGRPMADAAEIFASLLSRASEEGAGSRVRVRLEAFARPFGASGGRAQDCTTTGRLEQDLLGLVRELSAADSPEGERGGEGHPATPERESLREAGPRPASVAGSLSGLPWEAAELAPGDRIRVWVGPDQRLTGTFMGVRTDSLMIRRSRPTPIPFHTVESIEVQRTRKGYAVGGGILGAAIGIGVAVGTDLGITGRHDVQGEILNPGLGAIAGGLIGALLGHGLLGSYWERISLHPRS